MSASKKLDTNLPKQNGHPNRVGADLPLSKVVMRPVQATFK